MSTTVLVFHPHLNDGSRVNARLASEARAHASDGIEVVDEYALYPDGRIDATREQERIAAADRVVLQFPMWWYSSPALLKQWQDDVLAYGWAYGEGGDKLRGKEFQLAVTTGSTAEEYTHEGRHRHTVEELLAPFWVTFDYCGATWVEPFLVEGTPDLSDEALDRAAADYVESIRR